MPHWWRDAHFTQGEAADIAGLRESTLRDWLAKGATMFVSERRRSGRWLSAEDILVVRIAAELVRGGFVTLLALAIAKRHVDGALWFPSDALLAAKPGSSTETGVRLCGEGTIPDWDSIQIIKFGRIAHDILQTCEAHF